MFPPVLLGSVSGANRDHCATMQTLNLVHMIPIRWPRTEKRAFCKKPPASPSFVLQNTPCAPYALSVLRPSPLQVFRLPCDWRHSQYPAAACRSSAALP